MKILFIFSLFFLALRANAQPGCTDPQATNFDPVATENDGSCSYPPTSLTPVQVALLPDGLEECSGLAFFDNQLWAHLDGGSPAELFSLDTLTGEVLQTAAVPGAGNLDWEDLAEGPDHLFIGDFGNNNGDRTDLRIYKIKKTDLLAGPVLPEAIDFVYSDQTDFTPAPNDNNFDCEAFFYWQDSLHLFSKNWVDQKTRHYVLPAVPGTHTAQLQDSLDVQGLITAADISDDGTVLLLGYQASGLVFAWLLFDFPGSHFFSGNKRRVSLGNVLSLSQAEGLAFRDSTRGFICSERFSLLPQKLLAFDVRAFLENPVGAAETPGPGGMGAFSVFPNPASDVLNLHWEQPAPSGLTLRITDAAGRVVLEKQLLKTLTDNGLEVNIAHLRSGKYGVILDADGRFLQGSFFKK